MTTSQALNRPVLIMAGGTGGHVFPALALARLLRGSSQPVVWLGTRRGLEARVVPAEGIAIEWLSIGGLRGKGVLTLLLAPLRLVLALWQALRIMWRLRPAVVVGLGGFVTGPGGLAAWLCRRPLLIHEQNAVAGFTNRCLARFADEVLTAFPGAFASDVTVQQIGNPVRLDISGMPGPALRWAHRVDTLRVLVVGGSLGAMRLNTVVAPALALLQREGLICQVRHQAGERGVTTAQAAYDAAGLAAEVTAFVDDMAGAYAWADVVICRAGALTVSELAAAGLPAILVPYPHAVDDHQTRNAQVLVDAGAALCIADAQLDAPRLAADLQQLGLDRASLLPRAERARALARPDAAAQLLAHCLAHAAEAA